MRAHVIHKMRNTGEEEHFETCGQVTNEVRSARYRDRKEDTTAVIATGEQARTEVEAFALVICFSATPPKTFETRLSSHSSASLSFIATRLPLDPRHNLF